MPHIPATIVCMQDVSDSMRSFGYLEPAKNDLSNFVNLLQDQDRFSVISFSDSVYPVYPTSFKLETVTGASTLHAATAAIAALSSKNMTNMKAAINEANSIMGTSPAPHGMVLLSDGLWNVGGDPLPSVKTSPPIFTIALGDNGQVTALQKISNKSSGVFQLTPDSIGLASIYFDIVGQAKVAQTVYNRQTPISAAAANGAGGALALSTVPAVVRVRTGQDNAVMTVNWDKDSVGYVYGDPVDGKIGVQVMDPDFNIVHPETLYEGMGFVTFRVASPMAGNWQMFASYNGSDNLTLTMGGFDPDDQTGVGVALSDQFPERGGKVELTATLHTNGEAHAVRHAIAEVERPDYDIDEVVRTHADKLAGIKLGEDLDEAQIDHPDRLRFHLLAAQEAEPRKLAPRRSERVPVTIDASGTVKGTFPADLPGVHVIHLEIYGEHPDGDVVMRTRKASYAVR